ncbi:transposase [Aquiflexum sp.]|uniref:transposase n=1 Tax=Aquiflexum sp. TaxID=1872584 RepID=UPI0035943767
MIFNPKTFHHEHLHTTPLHIIFSTYKRTPTLHENGRPELFSYISGLLKNKKCHLYRINGMEDHLHIHPCSSDD